MSSLRSLTRSRRVHKDRRNSVDDRSDSVDERAESVDDPRDSVDYITPSFAEMILTLAEGVTKRVPAERFFKPILSTVHKTSRFEQVWFLY